MKVFTPVLNDAFAGKSPSIRGVFRLRKAFRSVTDDMNSVWRSRGLHSSEQLGRWLGRILEGRTFDHATAVSDVKIVAADICRQQYKVYSKEYGPMPLANAVHASVSIPLFFDPFVQGTDLYVDGGILSNFPAFLFADSKFPTIGFRLRDLVAPSGVTSTLSYLKALFQTMVEAHDKERTLPRHYFQYDIVTPPHIPFNKFSLNKTDVAELLNAGQQVGRTVLRKDHESKERRVSFFDPNAEETLDFAVLQAQRLHEAYSSERLWVDEMLHEAEFVVRIDEAWSATYDRYGTFSVFGDKPLVMQRFRAGAVPQQENKVLSLMDLDCTCEEVLSDGRTISLIRIPAWNSDRQKGFLLFYDPPVTPSHNHRLKLSIRVLFHVSLPPVLFSSDFGKSPGPPRPVTEDGGVYDEYRVDLMEKPLGGETVFNLQFRIDPAYRNRR